MSRRRGSTRSRASAREGVKLFARCSRARRHVTACRVEPRLRPTSDWAKVASDCVPNRTPASADVRFSANSSPGAIRLHCRPGLAPFDGEGSDHTPSGVCSETGCAVERFESLGDFAPQIHRRLLLLGDSRLAAAVILWSGAQGQGRSNARDACIASAQLEDRKTSRLISVNLRKNSEEGELNQYGSTVFGQNLRSPGEPHERTRVDW
jgi:hypothetical protein